MRHHTRMQLPAIQPDALPRPAGDGPCGQPRPGRPAAADLPQDHRRVRGRGGGRGVPRGDRQLPVRDRSAELRRPDPDRLAASPARDRRDPVRWRVRGTGPGHRVSRASRCRTSCRGSADRPSTRSATACSPSSSRRSGAASRSAPTSPAGTSARSSWPWSACRSSRPSAGVARRSSSDCRRSRSPSRSCCSSASEAQIGRRPSPAAASARRSGGSCATPTCAGST